MVTSDRQPLLEDDHSDEDGQPRQSAVTAQEVVRDRGHRKEDTIVLDQDLLVVRKPRPRKER